ncbi:MAG: nickel-dependent lactate racemase [Bacillota bacterium]
MELKYGTTTLEYEIDEARIDRILRAQEKEGLANPEQAVTSSLENPVGTAPLDDLLKAEKPEKVVLVVNDVSRPTPYEFLLPPLLEKLADAGVKREQITFLVATGTHDPHTPEQNCEVLGSEIVEKYEVVSHRAQREEELVNIGQVSTGNQITLNQRVVEADFVITTGVILPHYFAGFSGGRKSIMLGVAGKECIQHNHSRMVDLLGNLPPVEENPISQEMMESAAMIGLDFILNVVTNSKREIVQVVAGDFREAWYQGVKTSAGMYHVSIPKKVDAAIVSAGGYPRDINFYQAQKALDHADHAVKEGGTIILAAECRDGLGEDTFAHWVEKAQEPQDNIKRIKKGFVLGGHKAFAVSEVVEKKELILLSDLDQQTTEALFARKEEKLQTAVNYLKEKHGSDYRAVIMPEGSLTVPVV